MIASELIERMFLTLDREGLVCLEIVFKVYISNKYKERERERDTIII